MAVKDASKAAAKSKTIIGIVLAFAVQLAPELGISFGEDDATLFSNAWDTILTAIASVFAVYGWFTEKAPEEDEGKNETTLQSPWPVMLTGILLVAGGFLLSACSSNMAGLTPEETSKLHPEARYYQLMAEYNILVDVAADYSEQPFCDDEIITACADPDLVIKLDSAAENTFGVLEATKNVVLAERPQNDKLAALQTANNALAALSALLTSHYIGD